MRFFSSMCSVNDLSCGAPFFPSMMRLLSCSLTFYRELMIGRVRLFWSPWSWFKLVNFELSVPLFELLTGWRRLWWWCLTDRELSLISCCLAFYFSINFPKRLDWGSDFVIIWSTLWFYWLRPNRHSAAASSWLFSSRFVYASRAAFLVSICCYFKSDFLLELVLLTLDF